MLIHPGAAPQNADEKAVIGFLDDWGPRTGPTGDGIVLTERIDRVFLADGTEAIAIPIMGCFTVRSVDAEPKIARYADYNADSPIRARFPRHRH